MAATGCDEHGDAAALSKNGELSVALFMGVETVTEENAGAAHTTSAEATRRRNLMQVLP